MNLLPKNKTGGVVTNTTFGVGALIIGIIITLVIVQTLTDTDLLTSDSVTTLTVTNETITMVGTGIVTITELGNDGFTSWNATTVINGTIAAGTTPSNETLVEGTDYQIFSANGSIGNITTFTGTRTTLTWVRTLQDTSNAVDNMTANFTDGIDKISAKIPTILLIVAVVFLFGALVLLLRQSNLMGIGGGSSL